MILLIAVWFPRFCRLAVALIGLERVWFLLSRISTTTGCKDGCSNNCRYDRDILGWWFGSKRRRKITGERTTLQQQEVCSGSKDFAIWTILNVCLRRKCVGVVVKDRGPFPPKMDLERRIDLSYAAALAVDTLQRQRVRVSVPTQSLALKSRWPTTKYWLRLC